MAPTSVVIIGASITGITAAHAFLNDNPGVKVVLINPSTLFYWNIGAPRLVAKPKVWKPEQYLLPIKDAFAQYSAESFEFIAGSATAIDVAAKTVSVSVNNSNDTKSVSYDHLLIASGATTPSTTGALTGISIPFKTPGRDDAQQIIETAQQAISGANAIVIGGGGPVGVEFAGEIAEAAAQSGRQVSITLVSMTDRVLHVLKPSASYAAEKQLKQKKVKIISSARVDKVEASGDAPKSWTVSLNTGEKLEADLYIPTTGILPNNSFIPAEFLDRDGWVKVNKELRVQSSANSSLPIYAAGDITTNTMRLSFKAVEQARIAVANIKADIAGHGERKSYDQGESMMMLVPVGETGGTGQIFGFVPFSCMIRFIKGKDFFISKAPSFLAGKA
ncbi:Apoptosis-inducing factor [Penicillium hispanicum]|uniref:Apoptosis-inducing factor n=1 Tax=Penicillium hispanicum TaxID=1080232 RepID=UPI00254222E7|nr:Apoptosis-inducing factor [Penicillium hispanicum]KAJ5578579.1 Apoptosis-inducing factor [Penicillium hispanicum]